MLHQKDSTLADERTRTDANTEIAETLYYLPMTLKQQQSVS